MNPICNELPYKNYFLKFPSKQTICTYAYQMEVARKHLGKELYEASEQELDRYINTRRGDGVSDGTLRVIMTALSTYYKWLCRTHQRANDPSIVFKDQNAPKRLKNPKGLDNRQIEQLESVLRDDTVHESQIKAYAYLGMQMGMRLFEMQKLKWSDIDFDKHWVAWVRKRQKCADHPLPTKTYDALVHLEMMMRGSKIGSEWVFFNRDNWILPLSRSNIAKWSGVIRKRCGWDNRVRFSTHSLRHTTAQILIDAGESMETTKEVMDHDDITTTDRYYKANRGKVNRAHLLVMG